MKKVCSILIALFLGIVMLFGVTGCGEITGKFYSLQEAYDYGYLTKENLESIAYYHNEEIEYPEALDSKIEEAIKETEAANLRNREHSPIKHAKAEDLQSLKYYGVYQKYYVVLIENPYGDHPDDLIDAWVDIAGVKVHYQTVERIKVWKELK